MEEAARSIRVGSTTSLGFLLAGFVAGEGSFIVTTRQPHFRDGTPRLRFVLQVAVAARDTALLEQIRNYLGFGSIHSRAPEKPHHESVAVFTVSSLKAHIASTIPWADAHLLASAKRRTYELWRSALLAYEAEHPRRLERSRCSEPDCNGLVRGRGLCRRHYYRATGY